MLKPGDTLAQTFILRSPSTGGLANAGTPPTAVIRRAGVTDGTVTVTVSNNSTGDYRATCVIPESYADGDVVQIVVSATVEGVADKLALPSHVVGTKAGFSLAPSGADLVEPEPGINWPQSQSLILAAVAGQLSGAAGTTVTIKNPAGDATRLTVTVDADGNRTLVVTNPPA